jgi:hypothetical protein
MVVELRWLCSAQHLDDAHTPNEGIDRLATVQID